MLLNDLESAGQRSVRSSSPRLSPLLAGAWVVATGLMLIRPAGLPTWRVLWAEDGSRFLAGAIDRPGPATWLEPYAGYRHLVPRLIGDVASRLPLGDAAVVFAFLSAAVAGVALVLFAVGLLGSPGRQAGLVVALACTHALAGEASANAANLHWYLTLGLVGLALLRPRSSRSARAAGVLAAAFALSDPLAPLAALFAVACAWRFRRSAPAWAVPAAVGAGALVQTVTMLTDPRTPATGPPIPVRDLPGLYLRDVVRDGISPGPLGPLPDDALLIAVLAATAMLLGLALARRSVLGAVLLLSSPAVFTLTVTLNHAEANRYAALPVALLVSGALTAAPHRLFTPLCLALVTLSCLSLPTHPTRTIGPDFRSTTTEAAKTCTATRATSVKLRIAPTPWTTTLPCARLTMVVLYQGG